MNESRGNLYLFTGLVLGLAIGLLYAWVIDPVEYVSTDPDLLAPNYKQAYRRVVAMSYQANPDLPRARERLVLLGDGQDMITRLDALAQQMLSENQSPREARALSALAADLKRPRAGMTASAGPTRSPEFTQAARSTAADETVTSTGTTAAEEISTPDSVPSPEYTPTPAFSIRPSATPREALSTPFELTSQQPICDGSIPPGLLQVQVSEADGQPLPGVRIQVTWQDGEDIFYTGLSPEINPGYADFRMTPGTLYSLKVGEASQPVTDLSTDGTCGWRLEFSQADSQ